MEKSEDNSFDEIYETEAMRIARKGRIVQIENIMSPDIRKEFINNIEDRKKNLSEDIEKQVKKLEELISKYNPIDILGNIKYRNAVLNTENYKEYSHDGNDAYVEYLSVLFLCKPLDSYPDVTTPIKPGIIENIQKRIENLFSATIFSFGIMGITTDSDENEEEQDVMQKLRFETLGRSLAVRYMDYGHHQIENLRSLFEPIRNEMRDLLGFTIGEAITIATTMGELETDNLNYKADEARKFVSELKKAVKIYRKKKKEKRN